MASMNLWSLVEVVRNRLFHKQVNALFGGEQLLVLVGGMGHRT